MDIGEVIEVGVREVPVWTPPPPDAVPAPEQEEVPA